MLAGSFGSRKISLSQRDLFPKPKNRRSLFSIVCHFGFSASSFTPHPSRASPQFSYGGLFLCSGCSSFSWSV